MSRRVRFVLLACLAWSLSVTAHALSSLEVEGCVGAHAKELEKLLAIELSTLGVSLREVESLRVTCQGDSAKVTASLVPARTLENEFSLDARHESLTRLLALRISELLTTSLSPEPPEASAPTPEASVAPEPDEPAYERRVDERVSSRPSYPQTSLALSTRHLGKPGAFLFGAAIAHELPLFGRMTLHADLGAELGVFHSDVADVDLRQLTMGLSALWSERRRYVDAHAGLGFRVAYCWLAARGVGEQHMAETMSAPWAGPFAMLAFSFHGLRSPWHGLLGFEAGLVTVPITGLLDDTDPVVSIEGLWLSAQLGVARRF